MTELCRELIVLLDYSEQKFFMWQSERDPAAKEEALQVYREALNEIARLTVMI